MILGVFSFKSITRSRFLVFSLLCQESLYPEQESAVVVFGVCNYLNIKML